MPKSYALMVLLLLSASACNLWRRQPKAAPPHLDEQIDKSVTCPSSSRDWQSWRTQALGKLIQSRYAEADRAAVGEVFVRCQQSLHADFPKAERCLQNIQSFSRPSWLKTLPGRSLGLESTDQAYLDTVPEKAYFELPPLLQSQEFLQALDRDQPGLERAMAMLAEHNAKVENAADELLYFAYHSANLHSPDLTAPSQRLFVLSQRSTYVQFIQFVLRDSPSNILVNDVPVVAVQKAQPQQVFFNDMYRVRTGKEILLSTRLKESSYGLADCTSCHKTAVLPIRPKIEDFDQARFGPALAKANAAILEYAGAPAASFPPGRDGPFVGSGKAERYSAEFFRKCAGPLAADAGVRTKLAAMMNCADCHNGKSRGGMTLDSVSPMQLPNGGNLLQKYVIDLKLMPIGADLSTAERQALVSCLVADYSSAPDASTGLLEQWLLQSDCQID